MVATCRCRLYSWKQVHPWEIKQYFEVILNPTLLNQSDSILLFNTKSKGVFLSINFVLVRNRCFGKLARSDFFECIMCYESSVSRLKEVTAKASWGNFVQTVMRAGSFWSRLPLYRQSCEPAPIGLASQCTDSHESWLLLVSPPVVMTVMSPNTDSHESRLLLVSPPIIQTVMSPVTDSQEIRLLLVSPPVLQTVMRASSYWSRLLLYRQSWAPIQTVMKADSCWSRLLLYRQSWAP